MSSTKQPFVHYNKLGGMDRSVRPFNLRPEQWFLDFNMRPFKGELRQVPLKRVRQYTIPFSGRTLLEMVSLPTPSGSVLLGLTEDKVKRITNGSAANLKEAGVEVTLNKPASSFRRFGKTVFNNRLFFCNELNAVKYTDGATVTSIVGAPCGRYVELWFDHLVVGAPIFPGEDAYDCVAWSNLEEWGNFTPDTHSEADRYVFTEHQADYGLVAGVTGVRKLGNACVVYTASSIQQMRYVGLPRVVRVDPVVQDFGNGLRYALLSVRGRHYFIDTISQDFVCFTGMGVELIGDAIKRYFFDTLHTDPEMAQRTWGYYDRLWDELWWVYVSNESDRAFDRAVVYNLGTKSWWVASVENVHCFATTIEDGVRTCDELQGTCNGLQGSCDRLGGETGLPVRLWGGENERLMVEETEDDTTTSLLAAPVPVLETGDDVYGGVQQIKEIDSVAVQSKIPHSSGLTVELAKRANLDDPVTFDKVGRWNPDKAPVLSIKPAAERVFRWRFRAPDRDTSRVLIYASGVADFTLRVEMPSENVPVTLPVPPPEVQPPPTVPPLVGYYVVIQAHNPFSDCSHFLTGGGTVNNVTTLDGEPAIVERMSGATGRSFDAGGSVEVFRIFIDEGFLALNTVAPGPELQFNPAFSFARDKYSAIDGVCTFVNNSSFGYTYLQLLNAVIAQFSTHTGQPDDPFVVSISDS